MEQIPLNEAVICINCNTLARVPVAYCPHCAGEQLVAVAKWLNPKPKPRVDMKWFAGQRVSVKIIAAFLFMLLAFSGAEAGSKKYNSKGAGQAKRESVISRQLYMNWLSQGCPSLVQPQQLPPERPFVLRRKGL